MSRRGLTPADISAVSAARNAIICFIALRGTSEEVPERFFLAMTACGTSRRGSISGFARQSVRGGLREEGRIDRLPAGQSPRGRGGPRLPGPPVGRRGSIPAWAGRAHGLPDRWQGKRVDPRVGGAGLWMGNMGVGGGGRSPRGRGGRRLFSQGLRAVGSIPAWAGRAGSILIGLGEGRFDPRAGGAGRATSAAVLSRSGRSPRRRGGQFVRGSMNPALRSIPAQAGRAAASRCRSLSRGGDPRAGEAGGLGARPPAGAPGRSPRRRGGRRRDEELVSCNCNVLNNYGFRPYIAPPHGMILVRPLRSRTTSFTTV